MVPFLKRYRIWFAVLLLIGAFTLYGINQHVLASTQTRIHPSAEDVSPADVALVLGCAPRLNNGARNLYFDFRILAAAELYHAGKVKHLLLSGANPTFDYNEPAAMQQALLQHGVPEAAMTLDFAGLRTLDSIVRARAIFGLANFVVVSQRFHLYRALYIADDQGIAAIGFVAPAVPRKMARKTHGREVLARLKAFIDLKLINKQPRYLGDAEPIQLSEKQL